MPYNHPISKKELFNLPGWSKSLWNKYLNDRYYEILHNECGYNKTDRILTPKILKKIAELVGPFSDPNEKRINTLPTSKR
jgi:hypothetical protein